MSPVSTYIMSGKVRKKRKKRKWWILPVILGIILLGAGWYYVYRYQVPEQAPEPISATTPAPMVRTQDSPAVTPDPATSRATNPVARVFATYRSSYEEGSDMLGYQIKQSSGSELLPWQLRASFVSADILSPEAVLADLTQEGNGWTGEGASVQTTEAGRYSFELEVDASGAKQYLSGEMNLQNNSLSYSIKTAAGEAGELLGYVELVQSQNGFIAQSYSYLPPYVGVTRFYTAPQVFRMSYNADQSYEEMKKAYGDPQTTFEALSAGDQSALIIEGGAAGSTATLDGKVISAPTPTAIPNGADGDGAQNAQNEAAQPEQ